MILCPGCNEPVDSLPGKKQHPRGSSICHDFAIRRDERSNLYCEIKSRVWREVEEEEEERLAADSIPDISGKSIMLKVWHTLRERKDFDLADKLRDGLSLCGVRPFLDKEGKPCGEEMPPWERMRLYNRLKGEEE